MTCNKFLQNRPKKRNPTQKQPTDSPLFFFVFFWAPLVIEGSLTITKFYRSIFWLLPPLPLLVDTPAPAAEPSPATNLDPLDRLQLTPAAHWTHGELGGVKLPPCCLPDPAGDHHHITSSTSLFCSVSELPFSCPYCRCASTTLFRLLYYSHFAETHVSDAAGA
jgi:hypothetical protein